MFGHSNIFVSFKVQSSKFKVQSSKLLSPVLFFTFYLLLFTFSAFGQTAPSPKSVLGCHPTDDKTIADWSQITNYFQKLDAASDRVLVREIGKTTLGKPMIVAFISSPENIKNLEKYKRINQALANP